MTAADPPFTEGAPLDKGGRPPKLAPTDETYRYLQGLGSIQATKPEVAAVMGVSLPTLRKFFNDYPAAVEAYEGGMGIGKMSLRRRQWKMAEKNPTMAIWLGKNWLGQKDRATHEHTGANGGPIATVNLETLTDEELDAYERLCLRLGGEPVPAGEPGGDPGGEAPEGGGEEPI